MGFLKSKSAHLTINGSPGLNWLESTKEKAIEGECRLVGPSVHMGQATWEPLEVYFLHDWRAKSGCGQVIGSVQSFQSISRV